MSYSKDDVFTIVKDALVDLFDIDEAKVVLDATLYEDLDIDSIDAGDRIVRLKEKTGKKPDVEAFKNVRTVSDVVELIETLLNQ